MKKKVIQMYFIVGISTDQLTPQSVTLTFEDIITTDKTDSKTRSQFNKSFKEAFTFSKQSSNTGRRARHK